MSSASYHSNIPNRPWAAHTGMRAIEKCPDWKCPCCMNRCGDHTAQELAACLCTERARIVWPTCGKPDEAHLDDEYSTCMAKKPVLKKSEPSFVKMPSDLKPFAISNIPKALNNPCESRCQCYIEPENVTHGVFAHHRSAGARLAAPEPLETFAMPTDQGVRLDNHQSASPIEQTRPQHQTPASRVRQQLGFQFVFLIDGQLLSQK